MKQHSFSDIPPFAASAIIAGAILVMLVAGFGISRAASQGKVLGRVEVAGVQLGGLDLDQALTALVAVEDDFVNRQSTFDVGGRPVVLDPHEVGLDIDEQTISAEAMAVGREGNLAREFLWWLSHLFSTTDVPVTGTVDAALLDLVFDNWDTAVIHQPVFPGAITLEGGELVPIYPETGTGVDRERAAPIVAATLLGEGGSASIPTTVLHPTLTRADVDAALAEAEQLLSGPIELVHDGTSAVFRVADLEAAFRSETLSASPDRIVNYFDPEIVDRVLNSIRAKFEDEPVDARFEIDGELVSVVPGRNGTKIDAEETARRLYQAGLTTGRIGLLPLVEGSEPDITTEYLESLNVRHLVVQFTTYHDCCQNRVINIHRIADEVDGTLILPGETWSLNDHVGQRTVEDGYVEAPGIFQGELVPSVGGGTSQFTTTLYNAVFWGGYEDVEHKPHSYYFSRYPEGIEATLSWRTPDLVFKNNRDHAIIIDTSYTNTSITVGFYGFNDGRTLKGEQSGGRTRISVTSEGGPNALHVKGDVSGRYAFTSPGSPRYKPNPSLDVDQQITTQGEAGGWSVTVTRQIELRGQIVETQQWVVRYAPQFAVYEVHPCKVPGAEEACPTTTTTEETTTTAGG